MPTLIFQNYKTGGKMNPQDWKCSWQEPTCTFSLVSLKRQQSTKRQKNVRVTEFICDGEKQRRTT
jgi:hypothetical protein